MAKHLVLEVSDSEAQVMQVSTGRRNEAPVLEAAFTVDFDDLPRDEDGLAARAERLRERFKQAKLGPGPVAILLPKQNSIIRTVQLPSAEEEELEGMAQFEAEKFIPFNVERHIISNQVLRLDAVNGSHVLITAVDGPVMDKALTLAAGCSLKPTIAEITSVALVRAFQEKIEPLPEDTSGILLHIGRYQTEISIVQGEMLMASRSQQLGVQRLLNDLGAASGLEGPITPEQLDHLDMATPDDFRLPTEGEAEDAFQVPAPETNQAGEACRAWVQRLVRFTRQTYEFATREHRIHPAKRVYLCGDAARIKGLADAFTQNLNVDTESFDPLGELKRSAQGEVEEAALPGMIPAYGTALRLIVEHNDPRSRNQRINLLPLEVIEEQQAAERRNLLAVSGAMVLITLVLVYLTIDAQATHSERLRDLYTEYNEDMAPIVEELYEKETQLEIIKGITDDRTPPLFILDQISTFPGIGSTRDDGRLTLTDFRYARNEVTVEGNVIDFDVAGEFAEFLENLEHTGRPVFTRVGTPQMGTLQLSHNRGNVHTFTINATLNTAGGSSR